MGYTDYGPPIDLWAIGCIMGELIDGQPLFAGESDIDQLYVIQKAFIYIFKIIVCLKVLGPLTQEQNEIFLRHPRFLGMKFPEVTKPETLEKRYLGKISKKALSFLKNLFKSIFKLNFLKKYKKNLVLL